tara:strand:- start:90 stop:362 length:273 start_codon:yes stop_codon:yes gene_type:complete
MKMELYGNKYDSENINELSDQRLEEILQEYPNFGKIYTIEDMIKIEQLMKENQSASSICKIMGRNVNSIRKVIEDISKIKTSNKSYRQNS